MDINHPNQHNTLLIEMWKLKNKRAGAVFFTTGHCLGHSLTHNGGKELWARPRAIKTIDLSLALSFSFLFSPPCAAKENKMKPWCRGCSVWLLSLAGKIESFVLFCPKILLQAPPSQCRSPPYLCHLTTFYLFCTSHIGNIRAHKM